MKTLQRFQYLKRIAQNESEIHSAITVMKNERKDGHCKSAMLDRELCRKLGVRLGSYIFTLLALFEESREKTDFEMDLKLMTIQHDIEWNRRRELLDEVNELKKRKWWQLIIKK